MTATVRAKPRPSRLVLWPIAIAPNSPLETIHTQVDSGTTTTHTRARTLHIGCRMPRRLSYDQVELFTTTLLSNQVTTLYSMFAYRPIVHLLKPCKRTDGYFFSLYSTIHVGLYQTTLCPTLIGTPCTCKFLTSACRPITTMLAKTIRPNTFETFYFHNFL